MLIHTKSGDVNLDYYKSSTTIKQFQTLLIPFQQALTAKNKRYPIIDSEELSLFAANLQQFQEDFIGLELHTKSKELKNQNFDIPKRIPAKLFELSIDPKGKNLNPELFVILRSAALFLCEKKLFPPDFKDFTHLSTYLKMIHHICNALKKTKSIVAKKIFLDESIASTEKIKLKVAIADLEGNI